MTCPSTSCNLVPMLGSITQPCQPFSACLGPAAKQAGHATPSTALPVVGDSSCPSMDGRTALPSGGAGLSYGDADSVDLELIELAPQTAASSSVMAWRVSFLLPASVARKGGGSLGESGSRSTPGLPPVVGLAPESGVVAEDGKPNVAPPPSGAAVYPVALCPDTDSPAIAPTRGATTKAALARTRAGRFRTHREVRGLRASRDGGRGSFKTGAARTLRATTGRDRKAAPGFQTESH